MNIRDEYYSIEARINNVKNKKEIKEVIVEKSTDGRRYESIIGNRYKITVLPEEYERAVQLAKNVNNEKITESIMDKVLSEQRQKEDDELCKPFEPGPKKVKSKPKDVGKNKKFTVNRILVRVIAGVLSVTAVIGGVKFASKEVEEFKTDVASESLETLKETLNAKEIRDNSSETSSNSGYIEVKVKGNNGGTYTYYASVQDGKIFKENDRIGNDNVVSAVRTVANAQNGNLIEAMQAKKLIKDIEKGRIDLTYSGNKEIETEEIGVR